MKLKFKNQQFQTDAVNAVVELFAGQEKDTATFSIIQNDQLSLMQNEFGIGNALRLSDMDILANMHRTQKRRNLPLTDALNGRTIEDETGGVSRSFCVEMETGTGKTYCYTKTIFEMNKRYGFTKFIIVVPSLAIREGVYKSFEITSEHFGIAYNNAPNRFFIYDSKKLSDVRQFATSANIEIMIINIDAFKKSENIINQAQDKLNGETAMRYIQDTHPIVIIDEPQSVDNTPKAKEAIASLKPLCVLRYSATHREKINLLYRLTPVDAYQMGLVKQICVSSNQVFGDFNKPYIKLLSVTQEHGFKAKIEIDVRGKDGKVVRKTLTVKPSTDLFLLSGERELYEGYTIAGIDCSPGYECIEFANTETVRLHKSIGDIDELAVKRAQIRRTIEAHLDKEKRYYNKGIKVLSLFFIDEVKKYRVSSEKLAVSSEKLVVSGDTQSGIYAEIFEECYISLINSPKYQKLRKFFHGSEQLLTAPSSLLTKTHNGYFSQDKKGNYKNTKGDTLDDTDTYNTIMRDKEWLLSFDCPLRFIWSHSALKEGWDNPNVFQVCTLIEQKSAFTCRQKVGRGLRLCVDQTGERIEDKDINVLHVMANESFAEFAETLQKEIEDETGVKFGILQIGLFSGLTYTEEHKEEKKISRSDAQILIDYLANKGFITPSGEVKPEMQTAHDSEAFELPAELPPAVKAAAPEIIRAIATAPVHSATVDTVATISYTETIKTEKTVTYDDAKELIEHFEKKDYISKSGKIKDTMKSALQSGTLDLPAKYEAAREKFETIISRADKKPPIRDASRDVTVRLNKEVMISPEFLELWDKIKQKTAYRVQVDSAELTRRCVRDVTAMPIIPKARIISKTADLDIRHEGITHTEREMRTTDLESAYSVMPDVLAIIGEQTLTKRATVLEIIAESGRVKDLNDNPQLFIESCVDIIKDNRHSLAIDGIRYLKLDGEEYYVQEIFDSTELIANLDKNAVAVGRSVYDHIIYDSETVERPFAVALDNDPDVRMFFKIPRKFKIDTPIGTYNPDWAVYIDRNGVKKMYFVLETKGSTDWLELRGKEQLKIHCGTEHFKALDGDIELRVARDWTAFKERN